MDVPTDCAREAAWWKLVRYVQARWQVLSYYAVVGLSGLLGVIKALAYAGVLGSEALGYYALGMLIATYAQIVCQLGLSRGLECRLPVSYGSGDVQQAERLRNATAGSLVVVAVTFQAIVAIACVFATQFDVLGRLTLLLAGGLTCATLLLGLPTIDLRARGDLRRLARITLARTSLNLLLGVACAFAFGAVGVMAIEAGIALLLFGFGARYLCNGFRLEFASLTELRQLFCSGAPLTLRNFANCVGLTMDRWCITAALGIAAFGQYAFATIIVSAGMVVYTAIWSHLGPSVARAYGRDGNLRSSLTALRWHAIRILAMSIFGWLLLKLLIPRVLSPLFPQYADGALLVSILYWGAVLQLICIFDWISMMASRTAPLLGLTLIVLMFTGGIYGIAILQSWSLSAYAWTYVAGRGLTAGGQYLIAHWTVVQSETKSISRKTVALEPSRANAIGLKGAA